VKLVQGACPQMEYALHAATIMHTNVASDVRIARTVGYDGIELWFPKLARYLNAGYSTSDLRRRLGHLRVTMLDALLPIESSDSRTRRQLRADCEWMAQVAAELDCEAIQVVALDAFEGSRWPEWRRSLVASLTELSEIASPLGVRLALEPVTFSRFHSLAQALDVIDAVGSQRVGLCLDTWHLWTSDTPWEQVAELDPAMIVAVHIGDTLERTGQAWSDDDRAALPGEGVLPLREAIDAIAATGYEGMWAVEMKSRRHWEWEPELLASAILERTRPLVEKSG
jgi:sugar phosphate isomerase/epimerase